MNSRRLLPSLFVSLLMLYACGSKNDNGVSLWGYKFAIVTETNGVLLLEYDKDDQRIAVTMATGLNSRAASSYIQDKISVFRSLFEKQRVGYRGQHTEYVECPKQFKPAYHKKNIEGGTLQYFRSYANDRYITGVCSQDDVRYSAISAYLYCFGSRSIYEIDYFFPANSGSHAADFISKLRCE